MLKRQSKDHTLLIPTICIAIAGLSCFAGLSSYQISAENAARFPDSYGVMRAEARLAPLVEQLPPSARLDYITDIETTHSAYAAAFLAAQFALAPRQLLRAEAANRPEWALGNFSKPVDFAAAGAARGYEVAADWGNGVVLYRRTAGK